MSNFIPNELVNIDDRDTPRINYKIKFSLKVKLNILRIVSNLRILSYNAF